jgi:hypothetical protein
MGENPGFAQFLLMNYINALPLEKLIVYNGDY